jgi:hypothetical protein
MYTLPLLSGRQSLLFFVLPVTCSIKYPQGFGLRFCPDTVALNTMLLSLATLRPLLFFGPASLLLLVGECTLTRSTFATSTTSTIQDHLSDSNVRSRPSPYGLNVYLLYAKPFMLHCISCLGVIRSHLIITYGIYVGLLCILSRFHLILRSSPMPCFAMLINNQFVG